MVPQERPQVGPKHRRRARKKIQDYQGLFMEGLKAAGKKPTKFVKVRDLRQGPAESPDAFYE